MKGDAMTVKDPKTVLDMNEYTEWLLTAKRGDACKYYEYSIRDLRTHTVGGLRTIAASHFERLSFKLQEAYGLCVRAFEDCNAVQADRRTMGRRKVALVTRRMGNMREMLAIKI